MRLAVIFAKFGATERSTLFATEDAETASLA
jgi:hypothetical protein